MGTQNASHIQESIERSLEEVATELEKVGDEIRLKLHLASMDANLAWTEKLEPKLFEARNHAREAKVASKAAIQDTIKAFKDFSAAL